MVEVFKTNISDKKTATRIAEQLYELFQKCKINFDLDDCDKILRIESRQVNPKRVKKILQRKGYLCEVLE